MLVETPKVVCLEVAVVKLKGGVLNVDHECLIVNDVSNPPASCKKIP
jgi:hypothetical protein